MTDNIEYAEARGIVYKVQPTDMFLTRDYNMNIYRGCCHACIYCDSRSTCYQLDRFETVRPKRDALAIIDRELAGKRKTGLIGSGAMTDPYNPFERKLELTRGALHLIARYGFGIGIITKSDLVVRDIDILSAIAKHAPVDVHITITTPDHGLARIIEPYAPLPDRRFEAIAELSGHGIRCGVLITPTLPWITDELDKILEITNRAADCGAKDVVLMPGMTMREGSRDYYYQQLDRHFPGLRQRYEKKYHLDYVCYCEHEDEIMRAFIKTCEHRGLLYDFPAINRSIRAGGAHQMDLFGS